MNPIFLIIYCTWFASEIVLGRLTGRKSTDKQGKDKNTLLLIWVTVILAIFFAVFISMKMYAPIMRSTRIQYAGLAIIILGIILRIAAVLSLGKYFTVVVTIRSDHKLKTDGFYKHLRHPSYSASVLSFAGFGISLNNWISFVLVMTAVIAVFRIRIHIEEKLLIETFGSAYLEYKKKTSGFIPFIH